mmetsp:Transcript_27358/g.82427  ORF Transcript_27358/g.82427 Transcript_27358/m.82427 type:complete len:235 (-) Transcript_27358:134-838(-)
MKRAGEAYVDLDDLAELFDDDDDLPVRFYCLEPKEGTLEELVTLALSAEVGGANMACRPRLNEPEIKANVRHFEDPDETYVPPRSLEAEIQNLARPLTRAERRRLAREAEGADPEPTPARDIDVMACGRPRPLFQGGKCVYRLFTKEELDSSICAALGRHQRGSRRRRGSDAESGAGFPDAREPRWVAAAAARLGRGGSRRRRGFVRLPPRDTQATPSAREPCRSRTAGSRSAI